MEGLHEGFALGYDKGHDSGRDHMLGAGWQAGFPDADDPLKMYRCVDEAFDGGVQKGFDKGFDNGFSNACLAISTFALSKAEGYDND